MKQDGAGNVVGQVADNPNGLTDLIGQGRKIHRENVLSDEVETITKGI